MENIWTYYEDYFNKIGKNKENIVHIPNFLEEQDRIEIMNFLNTKKDDPDFSGGKTITHQMLLSTNKKIADLVAKYEDNVYPIVQEYFCKKYDIKVKKIPWNPMHFVKWHDDMSSGLHSDCQYPNGDPLMKSNYFRLNITALIYPNDDYEGGEIGWPDYNLEIKPSAGDLVMFPANNSYLHYVNKVSSGVRYTMPMWYTFDFGFKIPTVNYQEGTSRYLWVNEGGDTSKMRSY